MEASGRSLDCTVAKDVGEVERFAGVEPTNQEEAAELQQNRNWGRAANAAAGALADVASALIGGGSDVVAAPTFSCRGSCTSFT